MKLLLLSAFLIVSSLVFAREVKKIPIDTIAVSMVDDVELSHVENKKLCDAPICQEVTEVKITFRLKKCQDELGAVTFTTRSTEEGLTIFISAINIHTQKSEQIHCVSPKFVTRRIQLQPGLTRDNVKLEVLTPLKFTKNTKKLNALIDDSCRVVEKDLYHEEEQKCVRATDLCMIEQMTIEDGYRLAQENECSDVKLD